MSSAGSERWVLFVCTHNAGRSIVAAALLNAHQPPGVRADSAGTDPSDALNPTVVTALAERGVSLAGNSTGSSAFQVMTWRRCGPSASRSTSRSRHSWTTSSDPRAKSLLRNSRVAVLAPVQGSLLEVGTLPAGFRPCVSDGWMRA